MASAVAGLFSGIGGLEGPLIERGITPEILCDSWEYSQDVLKVRHPDVHIWPDIATLKSLPDSVRIVTAGFPCTDLSQAGLMNGISGTASGLVSHVFRLIDNSPVDWVIIENVKNMLALDKGRAMDFIVRAFEDCGFSWAYRTVDSRFTGVPQRRQRVIFVASRKHNPSDALFFSNEDDQIPASPSGSAGFYWTEGLAGVGWAANGVPPLKGGSSLGIPSQPAIWRPQSEVGSKVVTPSIEDAEAMQGFLRGWTDVKAERAFQRARWKLIGNAVTYGIGHWIAENVLSPKGCNLDTLSSWDWGRWPRAAFGSSGKWFAVDANEWPARNLYKNLDDVVNEESLTPLSLRATSGFRSRTKRSKLRFDERFLADLDEHIAHWSESKAA